MSDNTSFHEFSKNTGRVSTITGIALLVIVITMVSPIKMSSFKVSIGKILSIFLLSYALTVNYKETNKFINSVPGIFTDTSMSGQRNNAILSYILSATSLGLIIYVALTFLF